MNGSVIIARTPDAVGGPLCDVILDLDGNRLVYQVEVAVSRTNNQPYAANFFVTSDLTVGADGQWALLLDAGGFGATQFEGKVEISFRNRDTVNLTIAWGMVLREFTDR